MSRGGRRSENSVSLPPAPARRRCSRSTTRRRGLTTMRSARALMFLSVHPPVALNQSNQSTQFKPIHSPHSHQFTPIQTNSFTLIHTNSHQFTPINNTCIASRSRSRPEFRRLPVTGPTADINATRRDEARFERAPINGGCVRHFVRRVSVESDMGRAVAAGLLLKSLIMPLRKHCGAGPAHPAKWVCIWGRTTNCIAVFAQGKQEKTRRGR